MAASGESFNVDFVDEVEDVRRELSSFTNKVLSNEIDLNDIYHALEEIVKDEPELTKTERILATTERMKDKIQNIESNEGEEEIQNIESDDGEEEMSEASIMSSESRLEDFFEIDDFSELDKELEESLEVHECARKHLNALIPLYPDVDRLTLKHKSEEFGSDWQGLESWLASHIEKLPERKQVLALTRLQLSEVKKMPDQFQSQCPGCESWKLVEKGNKITKCEEAGCEIEYCLQLSEVKKIPDQVLSQCPGCESWKLVENGEIAKCEEAGCEIEYCLLCSKKDHRPFQCRENDEVYRKRVASDTSNIFKPFLGLPTSQKDGVKRVVMHPKNDMDWTHPLDILYMTAEATFLRMVDRYFSPVAPTLASVNAITRRSIQSIEYIENEFNTAAFLAKQNLFLAKHINSNERLCFHGTSVRNMDSILQENFSDGKIKRCAFGRGHYFSDFPDVSAGYGPGLLLCRLLLGTSWTDSSSANIPDKYNSKIVQADEGGRGRAIVIPDASQILPAFVIKLGGPK